MDTKMKVLLVVLAIVLVGIPLAGQFAARNAPAAPQGAVAAPSPAVADTPLPIPAPIAPPAPVEAPQPVAPQPAGPQHRMRQAQRPQQPQQPAPLNPQALVNSVWSIDGATIYLWAGGRLSAQHPQLPMQVEGTWSVQGNKLIVSAMGQTETVEIVGNEARARGKSVKRVR